MAEPKRSTKVAIVCYNSSELVEALLQSLKNEPIENIVIVDNASTPSQRSELERVVGEHENVKVEFGSQNLGFGGGVNKALALIDPADDDVVWVLNPDTLVSPGSTSLMVEALSTFDIVSPTIMMGTADEPKIWYRGGTVSLPTGTVRHLGLGATSNRTESPFATEFVTGAAPMFTGSTWRKTSGFRSELFLYWEDVDWSLRAGGLGLTLGVVPAAVIWHLVGGSGDTTGGKSATYYYYMQRNRFLVVADHGSPTLSLLFGRGMLETARLSARPLKESNGRFVKFRAGLRGLIAGARRRRPVPSGV
ncbi:glycosyltransferase family 2 protein [Herbiconiux sp. CPCC 205763]|uniref:Glycosyltransferase family 2 protein n=1 Tax=Herbiconiux aconitum TaxID=2970913 RepID=A0ABT2GNA1_9MICO|nr:glycosyltransferase family 2 protein [Herbiconiux aconitum]MCS5716760.1 glycosyltransferase family 2 protein [Herbiconiux aconitum]